MVSYNPNDIRAKYCGNCCEWHEMMSPFDREIVRCLFLSDGTAEVTFSCGHETTWINPPSTNPRYWKCVQCVELALKRPRLPEK
jgi:hypothetical protein